jgi:hypothetical protein
MIGMEGFVMFLPFLLLCIALHFATRGISARA